MNWSTSPQISFNHEEKAPGIDTSVIRTLRRILFRQILFRSGKNVSNTKCQNTWEYTESLWLNCVQIDSIVRCKQDKNSADPFS